MATVVHTTSINFRDADWVRRTFMLATNDMEDSSKRWALFTLSSQKFTDTRLGGNWTINNVPQYTRFSDIRRTNVFQGQTAVGLEVRKEFIGMGRFYEEQIDRNSQIVTLQFGLPEFNGLWSFFTGFYDNEAAMLANTGRGSIYYYVTKAASLVFTLPFLPYIAVGRMFSFLMTRPTSKYYYLTERMGLYWSRVSFIANILAVNLGLVPRAFGFNDGANPVNDATAVTEDYTNYMHEAAPDIWDAGGGTNAYAVSNRCQRLANARYNQLKEHVESATNRKELMDQLVAYIDTQKVEDPGSEGLDAYILRYHTSIMGDLGHLPKSVIEGLANTDVSQLDAESLPNDGTASKEQIDQLVYQRSLRAKYGPDKTVNNGIIPGLGEDAGLTDYYKANIVNGSDFVRFRVKYNGTVQESFSSSSRESNIASKINNLSSTNRAANFDFSNGNTGSDIVDTAFSAVKGIISNTLDLVHMSGLLSLAGSAFVDIPKIYESSSCTFPAASYTMDLITPYGHPISRYQNLWFPVSCLLAGALPISAGKAAYTAPFLCSCFQQGRVQIKLGILSSLTIERGIGNMGYNSNGECLGIRVSFEVMDLSSMMHAPIDPGSLGLLSGATAAILGPGGLASKALFGAVGFGAGGGIFDEDNVFSDYLAVLGNLSLADQTYRMRKSAIRLATLMKNMNTQFSSAHIAQVLYDGSWPARALSGIESAFVRGSEALL